MNTGAKVLVKLVKKAAVHSSYAVSLHGMYQPKEPAGLKKLKK